MQVLTPGQETHKHLLFIFAKEIQRKTERKNLTQRQSWAWVIRIYAGCCGSWWMHSCSFIFAGHTQTFHVLVLWSVAAVSRWNCAQTNQQRTHPCGSHVWILRKNIHEKSLESSESWCSPPDLRGKDGTEDRKRGREGGREVNKPRQLVEHCAVDFPAPPCTSVAPSTSHKSQLMSGCEKQKHNEGRAEWLTDPRSALRLSHRGGRRVRLETSLFGQAPLASTYEQTHTTTQLVSVFSHTSAGTLVHALCSVRVELRSHLWAKKKQLFTVGWKPADSPVRFVQWLHTPTHRLISLSCTVSTDVHQMAGGIFPPWMATFPEVYLNSE